METGEISLVLMSAAGMVFFVPAMGSVYEGQVIGVLFSHQVP